MIDPSAGALALHDQLFELFGDLAGGAGQGQRRIFMAVQELLVGVIERHDIDRMADLNRLAEGIALRVVVDGVANRQPDQRISENSLFWNQLREDLELEAFTTLLLWAGGLETPSGTSSRAVDWWLAHDPSLARIGLVLLFAAGHSPDSALVEDLTRALASRPLDSLSDPIELRQQIFAQISYLIERSVHPVDAGARRPQWSAFLNWSAGRLRSESGEDLSLISQDRQAWSTALEQVPSEARQLRWDVSTMRAWVDCLCAVDGERDCLQLISGALLVPGGWQPLVRLLDSDPDVRGLQSWTQTLRSDYALERLGGAGWAVLLSALAQRDLMAPAALWIAQAPSMRPSQASPLLQLAFESMAAVLRERQRRPEGPFSSLHSMFALLGHSPEDGSFVSRMPLHGVLLARSLAQLVRERPPGWCLETAECAGQLLLVGLNYCFSRAQLAQHPEHYRPLVGLAALVAERGDLSQLSTDDLLDPCLARLAVDLDRVQEPLLGLNRPSARHQLLHIALLAGGRLLQAQMREHRRTWVEIASLLAIPPESPVFDRALECSLGALLDAVEQSPGLSQADRFLAVLIHALPEEPDPELLARLQVLAPELAQNVTRRLVKRMLAQDPPSSVKCVVQKILIPWLESDRTEWSLEMLKVLSRAGMPQTLAMVIGSPRLPIAALVDMVHEWITYAAEPLEPAALEALHQRFSACLRLWKEAGPAQSPPKVGEALAGMFVLLSLSYAEARRGSSEEEALHELMQDAIDQVKELTQDLQTRLPIFDPSCKGMLSGSYRTRALAGDQAHTLRDLIGALRAYPFDASRMVWECPAPARLNGPCLRLLSCLMEISGAQSWAVLAPWLARAAAAEDLEHIPFLSRRAGVMGMHLLQIERPQGPPVRFVDLLASCDPQDLLLLFTAATLPPWARHSAALWVLSKGPLGSDQGLERWLAGLPPSDPSLVSSALVSVLGALVVLFPERGLRQLQHAALRQVPLTGEQLIDLYDRARAFEPAVAEWQVMLRVARFIAACHREQPLAEGLWTLHPALALWAWIAQAGDSHGLLDPQARLALLQPEGLLQRLAQLRAPHCSTARGIVEALQRRDPTRILAIALRPQDEILRDFGDCSDMAIGALFLLHAFSTEDWLRVRDLPQALRTAQYASVLAVHPGHHRRLNTLIEVLQTLRERQPAIGLILDQALSAVPIFHETGWLALRGAAGPALPATGVRTPPAWISPLLERAAAGEDLRLGSACRDRMFVWTLRDVEMSPVARLSESPTHWSQSDLQDKWEDLQEQWAALLFEDQPPDSWRQALRSFSALLFNPQAPRYHRAAEAFKHDWLTRLRRAIPPPDALSAEKKSELAAVLCSGLADLEPAVCSAGWDQLVNSWLEALGVPEELDTSLRCSLGRGMRAQMILVLGTLIGRPQDAHLKNRVNAACQAWPSEYSVGGLSPELLETSWRDIFPLQDHPEARPVLICRRPQAPALTADQVPPGTSDYDRRVVHLVRSELPRILSPTEMLELVLRQILLLPEQSDGLDLRSVARRVAEWAYPDEERQYALAHQIFQRLRLAQYERQRPSESLLLLTMASGAALGLWRLASEMPLPRPPEGL